MLDIQPSLLAFEIITFLALVAILNQILYKPMLSFMDERNSNLKADENLAGAQESEKEALIIEANRILADAKAEASKVRHEAINKAKADALLKVDAAKGFAKQEVSAFAQELASQKSELKSKIVANADSYRQSLAKSLKV